MTKYTTDTVKLSINSVAEYGNKLLTMHSFSSPLNSFSTTTHHRSCHSFELHVH